MTHFQDDGDCDESQNVDDDDDNDNDGDLLLAAMVSAIVLAEARS